MEKQPKSDFVGIAGLFDASQIKKYFINYVYFMVAVEVLILWLTFLGNMGGPFPVKFYFLMAFSIPLALTFLLGIFIISFNKFVFGKNPIEEDLDESDPESAKESILPKQSIYLQHVWRLPLFLKIALLIVVALLVYKMEAIINFAVSFGEQTAWYLMMAAGAVLAGAFLFSLVWIIASYRLRKKYMQYQYQYKKDVMEQLGLLVLNDDTVIDKKGHTVSDKGIKYIETDKPGYLLNDVTTSADVETRRPQ
jgi:uncharacterized membrane protein